MSQSPVFPARDTPRAYFHHFTRIQIRWNDLDAYGHVNNARFYTFYDTVIMHYLQIEGGFDMVRGPLMPFTLENACRFHEGFDFAEVIEAGMCVSYLGNSSVHYALGLYREGEDRLRACGYFVDVFVDADSRRPQAMSEALRAHLMAASARPLA